MSESDIKNDMVTHVREMELWTIPEKEYKESLARELEISFFSDLTFSRETFVPLSSVPSEVDSQNLSTYFSEGELNMKDFESFCIKSGFDFNEQNHLSACRFLEFNYGYQVAWIHVPESQSTESELARIAEWASGKELALVEPYALYCFCVVSSRK